MNICELNSLKTHSSLSRSLSSFVETKLVYRLADCWNPRRCRHLLVVTAGYQWSPVQVVSSEQVVELVSIVEAVVARLLYCELCGLMYLVEAVCRPLSQ